MKVRLDGGVSGVRKQKSGRRERSREAVPGMQDGDGKRQENGPFGTVSGRVAWWRQQNKLIRSIAAFAKIRVAMKSEGMPGHMQRGQTPRLKTMQNELNQKRAGVAARKQKGNREKTAERNKLTKEERYFRKTHSFYD